MNKFVVLYVEDFDAIFQQSISIDPTICPDKIALLLPAIELIFYVIFCFGKLGEITC